MTPDLIKMKKLVYFDDNFGRHSCYNHVIISIVLCGTKTSMTNVYFELLIKDCNPGQARPPKIFILPFSAQRG